MCNNKHAKNVTEKSIILTTALKIIHEIHINLAKSKDPENKKLQNSDKNFKKDRKKRKTS